jgi:hypothetical protein
MCRESSTSAASTTDPPTNQPTNELNWNGGWRWDGLRQWLAIMASIACLWWIRCRQRLKVQTHNREPPYQARQRVRAATPPRKLSKMRQRDMSGVDENKKWKHRLYDGGFCYTPLQ